MSRIFNGNFAAHLAGDSTTLCNCWEITLANNSVVRLTNHDKDLTFLGQTFEALNSFTASMLESKQGLETDNAEFRVVLRANAIQKEDIVFGAYDGARIRAWEVNWVDTADYCALPGGSLRNLKDSDQGEATFEVVGLSEKLTQQTGRIVQATCDANVGDSRCAVNMASFTHTGSITTATSRSEFTDSASAQADDYFNYGVITWTSGDNNGLQSEVKTYGSGAFVLFSPTPYAMQVGDTYSAQAGCDRTSDSCKNKFNNFVNFRGFPHVPGNFKAMSGPK